MINCLIVDDDNLMIHILETLLSEYDFLNIVAKVNSINETVNILNTNEIDLIFLDIEMPGISGIEFLENYNNSNTKIVIISSHEKYAIDAFQFNVLDYLLKPINKVRLLKTLKLLESSLNIEKKFHLNIFILNQIKNIYN